MTLEDRLRSELTRQSSQTAVRGVGASAVSTAARGRTRRARVVGATTVVTLLAAAGALAMSNRGQDSVTAVATNAAAARLDPGAADVAPTQARQGADRDTELSPQGAVSQPTAAPTPGAAAPTALSTAAAASSVDQAPVDADQVGTVTDLVAYKNGFIAVTSGGTNQAALWFSSNGETWKPVSDPRPSPNASISYLTSYNGVVHVAGDQPNGRVRAPWIARSNDLEIWEALEVPTPAEDGSDLVDTYTRLSSVASGPAGLIVTGDTVSELALQELLDPVVIAAEAWSLGDSSGDLSKLIVYDSAGDQIRVIDLVSAGVPATAIQAWAGGHSISFVAVATNGGALESLDGAADAGIALADANVSASGFTAGGFDETLSERLLLESDSGATWDPVSIAVVGHDRADTIGSIGERLVVLTATGPLLTVQSRDDGEWTETRLDQLFGQPGSDYELIDLVFGPTGAIGVVQTVAGSAEPQLWVIRTDDALLWTARPAGDFLGDEVTAVDAVGISEASLAVAYKPAAGKYNVAVIDR